MTFEEFLSQQLKINGYNSQWTSYFGEGNVLNLFIKTLVKWETMKEEVPEEVE